jgi:hypothetical protein
MEESDNLPARWLSCSTARKRLSPIAHIGRCSGNVGGKSGTMHSGFEATILGDLAQNEGGCDRKVGGGPARHRVRVPRLCRHCERSEAISMAGVTPVRDCVVAPLLPMTRIFDPVAVQHRDPAERRSTATVSSCIYKESTSRTAVASAAIRG